MNSSDIYWVKQVEPRRVAFGPRPRSGDWLSEEIDKWALRGIKHVASLLEASEEYELGLTEERKLCDARLIQFHALPIPDRGLPESTAEARAFISKLAGFVEKGEPVYVHCRMGIGRSGIITGGILLHLGVRFDLVFQMLGAARGLSVPDTQAQVDWLKSFSQHLAGAL